ncbi:hypothetical protein SNE40_015587 [Patella caerulea]|uniref:Twinfilin n=1 Tax=Patella caerulea TaxID=87958 RepID=A0AAN8JG03_PATCE
MSHQTGIAASEELRTEFARAKSGNVRVIKVSIEQEQMVLSESLPGNKAWDEEYDELVLPLLEEKQPCYILYRLDEKITTGYLWIVISWSPDFSPVRQKMLYAATRATLRKEFGQGDLKHDVFGTTIEDVNLKGYQKHKKSLDAPAPLTHAEEELKALKDNEVNAVVNIDTKHQTMQGVAFPLTKVAVEKLEELKNGDINYVQLSLDITKEIVNLEESGDVKIGNLPSKVPGDHPRYHLFTFKHTHEGDYMESTVFIYSMPGYKCSIKERMLYSSCKAPVVDYIQTVIGIDIVRKIESDDAKELTEKFIYEEVHPVKNAVRQAFAKPKGPANRGPRRMIRGKDGEEQ